MLFEQLEIMDIFFAPLKDCDKTTLERIESALIDQFRQCGPPDSPFLDNERRSRVIEEKDRDIEIRFVNQESLHGLNSRLQA